MTSIYFFQRDVDALTIACQAASAKVIKVSLQNYNVVVETNADLTLAEHALVGQAIQHTFPRLYQQKLNPTDPAPPAPPVLPPPKNIPIASLTGTNKWNINATALGVLITNPLP